MLLSEKLQCSQLKLSSYGRISMRDLVDKGV